MPGLLGVKGYEHAPQNLNTSSSLGGPSGVGSRSVISTGGCSFDSSYSSNGLSSLFSGIDYVCSSTTSFTGESGFIWTCANSALLFLMFLSSIKKHMNIIMTMIPRKMSMMFETPK